MQLDKAQKATCRRMTEKFVAKDPAAVSFFARLQEPMRSAFLAERTKIIGTVQQNEFGIPDEPGLNAAQIGSMVRNTRLELEGDARAVNFVEKIRGIAATKMAYAEAMMRIHDAIADKLAGKVATLKHGVPQVTVTHTPDAHVELAALKATEDSPEVTEKIQKLAEQARHLLTEAQETTELADPAFAEAADLLHALMSNDPQAIHLAAKVFSALFMRDEK
jgi:hypothetical protein